MFERWSKIRDQGFRKVITQLYDHRCALCGIRMLTPEGHTVVEAAHIKPWSENQDDRPTNGFALCRLCHWSFDEGLMGVGKDYEVLVSKRVRTEQNYLGHILTLIDRPIFKPAEKIYWPDKNNLEWHRKKKFGIRTWGGLATANKKTNWGTFYFGRIAIVVSQLSHQRPRVFLKTIITPIFMLTCDGIYRRII